MGIRRGQGHSYTWCSILSVSKMSYQSFFFHSNLRWIFQWVDSKAKREKERKNEIKRESISSGHEEYWRKRQAMPAKFNNGWMSWKFCQLKQDNFKISFYPLYLTMSSIPFQVDEKLQLIIYLLIMFPDKRIKNFNGDVILYVDSFYYKIWLALNFTWCETRAFQTVQLLHLDSLVNVVGELTLNEFIRVFS